MEESQMAQQAEFDSVTTEDAGWGSDNDTNMSDLCELVPKVNEPLAVHNSDSADAFDIGETTRAQGRDFELTIEGGRSSDDIVSPWDSDESDSDIHEGQRAVHVINTTQRSKKEKERKRRTTCERADSRSLMKDCRKQSNGQKIHLRKPDQRTSLPMTRTDQTNKLTLIKC